MVKLNLGCGRNLREGFVNVDKREDLPAVDKIFDLSRSMWPWANASVEHIEAMNVLQYIDQKGRIIFMEEAWRVLKADGTMVIQVPGRGSNTAICDPYVCWPEICEDWFHYFSAEGRKLMGADYDIKADFTWGYGWALSPEWAPKHQEAQTFAIKHYRDAMQALVINLKKIGPAVPVLEPEVAEMVQTGHLSVNEAREILESEPIEFLDPSAA